MTFCACKIVILPKSSESIMEKKIIASSELIINPDGSVFHLHLLPEQLTDRIILVGDPARVNMVAEFLTRAHLRCRAASSIPSAAHIRASP